MSRSALVLGTACGLLPPSASTSQGSERDRAHETRSSLVHLSPIRLQQSLHQEKRATSTRGSPRGCSCLRRWTCCAPSHMTSARCCVRAWEVAARPPSHTTQRPALRSFSFTPSGCEQAPSARCPCCTRSTLHMPGTRPRHVRDMSYAGARAALVRRGQRRPRLRGARVRRRAARRVRHLSFPRAAPLVLAAVQHVHPPPLLRLRHTRPKQPAPAYQQWPLNEKSC